MTHSITDISGNSVEVECLGCAIVKNVVEIRGGSVIRTGLFDVSQDFEIPIPGFMIVSSLRHVSSIDEFTSEESLEFIQILKATRKLQREVLGIETVYLYQEEDASHFHMWMFPRYGWMNVQFGRNSESLRPIMEYARDSLKTEENLAQLDSDIEKLARAASELRFS
jgi:diadenosine tetraphosphate (Ap4A) HIT family hydrolase